MRLAALVLYWRLGFSWILRSCNEDPLVLSLGVNTKSFMDLYHTIQFLAQCYGRRLSEMYHYLPVRTASCIDLRGCFS